MKIAVAIALLALVALWFGSRNGSPEFPSPAKPSESLSNDVPVVIPRVKFIDQNPFILDYGKEGGSDLKDLQALRDVVTDCQILFKDFDRYHLPGNPEITRFLQGSNPDKLAWIPEGHRLINDAGELLDRHGTPVFFHRLSGLKFEFRSAGPDRKYWTDDDVVLP